jgi:Fur family ferric uptake transcriptional regulator
MRMTRQRRIILEELKKVRSHPTADELYELVRKRLPKISLGTVYRNLEMMSEQGAIRELRLAGRKRRFDASMEDHYHIRCIRCGRLDDIFVELPPSIEDNIRKETHYKITGHRLKFTGICPECRLKEKAEKESSKKKNPQV